MSPYLCTLAALSTLVAGAASASSSTTRGDGHKVTAVRPVAAPFTRIVSAGSLDLTVKEASTPALSVTIDENLQRFVRTQVQDGTLTIDVTESIDFHGKAIVAVTMSEFRALELQGSGDARVELADKPREVSLSTSGSGDADLSGPTSRLEIRTHGSGEVSYSGQAGKVRVQTSGSGDVRLSGAAEALEATTHGSGDIAAKDFSVRDAEVSTTGSGDVALTLSGGHLKARTTGSGDLEWWGTAQLDDAVATGSGSLRHRE